MNTRKIMLLGLVVVNYLLVLLLFILDVMYTFTDALLQYYVLRKDH